jgi:hypothetical protein
MFNSFIGGKEMKNIHIPRKFFIALLIFALAMMILGLFVGCVPVTEPNDNVPTPVDYVYYKSNGSPGVYKEPVIKFEYNGHQYIRFGEYQSTCVVHDPDCEKCKQNNNSLFNW